MASSIDPIFGDNYYSNSKKLVTGESTFLSAEVMQEKQ